MQSERNSRKDYFRRLAAAQEANEKSKWINRMHDSTVKLVFDNIKLALNEF